MNLFKKLFGQRLQKEDLSKSSTIPKKSTNPSSPRKPTGYKYFAALEALSVIPEADARSDWQLHYHPSNRGTKRGNKKETASYISQWAREIPGRKNMVQKESEFYIDQSYRQWSEGYRMIKVFRIGEDEFLCEHARHESDR